MSALGLFWTSFWLGVRLSLAWRLDLLTRLGSGLVVLVLTGALWTSVTEGQDVVAGYSGDGLVRYAVFAWVVGRVATSHVDDWLGNRTRTGLIAHDLLRPGSWVAHFWSRDAGRAAVAVVTTALPLCIVGTLLFEISLTPSVETTVWVLVSTALGHAVAVGMALCVAATGLLIGRSDGLVHARGLCTALLSGALVPLDVYPPLVRDVARLLPFSAMADAPTRLLLGDAGWRTAVPILGHQAVWVVGLLLVAMSLTRIARREPVLRGG